MKTLDEQIDYIDYIGGMDSLRSREENPLLNATIELASGTFGTIPKVWTQYDPTTTNTGKVVTNGLTVTGASQSASAYCALGEWHSAIWAFGFKLAAHLDAGQYLKLPSSDMLLSLFKEGAGGQYLARIYKNSELLKEGTVEIGVGDRFAFVAFEGKLMLRKRHEGVWSTLLAAETTLEAKLNGPKKPPPSSGFIILPEGKGTSVRLTDYAAGYLEQPQPGRGSRSLLGVGK